jgi:uncharacterized membrane protein YkvA (DUF1232 family)
VQIVTKSSIFDFNKDYWSKEKMNSSSQDHYLKSSQEESKEETLEKKESLVERMIRFARAVGHFARLLAGLMLDERVDKKAKIFVGAVLAYIIAPLDFIPELFSGLFGMLDDFVLTAFALDILLNWVDPKVVKEHWFGEEDLLTTIQKGMKNAEVLMPDAILKKIEAWIGKYAEKSLVPVLSKTPTAVVEADGKKTSRRKTSRSKKSES